MNIRFLETIVRLSELKSFRLTAEQMHVTPAAISNRISAIEQELSVKLFERTTSEVHLTPEGAIVVEAALDIIDRYNRLVERVMPTEAVKGTVRIGLLPSMASTLLQGVMQILRERFPQVTVSITTDSSITLLRKLERRDLDIILCIPEGLPDSASGDRRTVELCSFRMVWIAGNDLPYGGEPLKRDDIIDYPFITYEVSSLNYVRMMECLDVTEADELVIHYSNSIGTTLHLVEAGFGISVIPVVLVQQEVTAKKIQILDVRPEFPSTQYAAIYLDNQSSRLAPLIASIASEVAVKFCDSHDPSIAYR